MLLSMDKSHLAMKTRISPLAVFLSLGALITSAAHGQFFIQAHGAGHGRIGSETFVKYDDQAGTVTRKPYNLGQGVGGGIAVGAMINERVGVEARFTYVSGMKLEIEEETTSASFKSESTDSYKSSFIRIEPALRMSTGAGKARWYMAAGPSLAIAPKLTYEGEQTDQYYNVTQPFQTLRREINRDNELTGGIGLGAFGAVGFLYQGGGALGFFAELSGTAQSWAPRKGHYETETRTVLFNGTASTDSDVENLDFVDEYNDDEDNKGLLQHFSMSTWGLRIGLHVQLGRGGE